MNTATHTPTPDGFEGDRARSAAWERMLLRDAAHDDLVAALRGLMAHSHAAAYALRESRPETADSLLRADEFAKSALAKAVQS